MKHKLRQRKRVNTGMPTLEMVSAHSGVSPATISRCLNHPELVQPLTRKKVHEAIDALGYVPNSAARTLASNRSRMIGAVFPSLETSLFGGMLEALQTTVTKRGLTVIVSSSSYDPQVEKDQVRTLIAHGVDALVLVGAQRQSAVYKMIEKAGIPCILTWVSKTRLKHPAIGFDNEKAAATLVNYLVGLGHESIGMISGRTSDNDRATARLKGVKSSLAANNLSLQPHLLIETDFGIEQGAEAFRILMQQPSPPGAIICGAELFAYGCYAECRRLGLNIPDDVSIVGIDNMDFATALQPPLTTIETPRREMGEIAGRHLLDVLDGKKTRKRYILDTELVIRDSAAGPSSRKRP